MHLDCMKSSLPMTASIGEEEEGEEEDDEEGGEEEVEEGEEVEGGGEGDSKIDAGTGW